MNGEETTTATKKNNYNKGDERELVFASLMPLLRLPKEIMLETAHCSRLHSFLTFKKPRHGYLPHSLKDYLERTLPKSLSKHTCLPQINVLTMQPEASLNGHEGTRPKTLLHAGPSLRRAGHSSQFERIDRSGPNGPWPARVVFVSRSVERDR